MEIIPCGKGHFYDKSMGECPQCAAERAAAGNAGNPMDYGKTQPATGVYPGQFVPDDIGATVPGTGYATERPDTVGVTFPANPSFDTRDFNPIERGAGKGNTVEDYPETRPAYIVTDGGSDPVVGWLVCVNGPNRGQDYRLHAGNNRIGRNPNNDVYLTGDLAVSGEDNCNVGFDARSGKFYFVAGTGKNMVYVNDQVIFRDVELKPYDVITVGNTNLTFVPFCGEQFSWNK